MSSLKWDIIAVMSHWKPEKVNGVIRFGTKATVHLSHKKGMTYERILFESYALTARRRDYLPGVMP